MNETAKYIHKTVYENAIDKQQWVLHRHSVRRRLEQLEPDIPIDGSANRIAFNVGNGKPRMKIKTGRFLTKKLQLNSGYMNDQMIQSIASKINMHLFASEIRVKLLNGSKITEAYKNEVGTSSCMTGYDAGKTRMYESNPDRFQMLTMHYADNSARAIVHKLDNGKYLLDRVYSDDEELKDKMRDYAKDHDWYYRENDEPCGYGISGIDDYSGIIVSGLVYDYGEIPYMDTLTEYRISGYKMDIFHSCAGYSADGNLDNTNGSLEECNTCEDCGETMCEDETYCINDSYLCRECVDENYTFCERCEEYCRNDDCTHIADKNIYVCDYCADHHYNRCEDCNDYYESLTSINDEKYVCESCLDDYCLCEGCDQWFTSDDITNGHCEDCMPEDDDIPKQDDDKTMTFAEIIDNAE